MCHLCRRGRAGAALILLALACAAIIFSSCEKTTTETVLVPVPGSCSQLYSWKSVWPPLTTTSLYAVYGSDEDDVFVVGDLGAIAHYNGTNWVEKNALTAVQFRDVWSSSPTNGYAVGYNAVYKYDGTSWNPDFSAGQSNFTCLWGIDMNNVWCGTTEPFVMHWNGTGWTQSAVPTYSQFFDMWGTSSNDIYAVGTNWMTNAVIICHYNGSNWSDVTPPGLGVSALYSVWGTASDNVYVAGEGSTIRRWNGSSWGTMNTTGLPSGQIIRAIRGRDASDIYVAFYNNVYRFNGSSWATTGISSALGIYPSIEDIWVGPTKLFAVGQGGVVVTYDGVIWHNENGGPWRLLLDVWTGGPQEAVVVGEGGVMLEFNGTTVTDATLAGVSYYLNGIAGSRDNLYVVGDGGGVLHYDGSAWADISNDAVVTSGLMDIWVAGSGAFAVGQNGVIVRISGTTLSAMTSGTTKSLYSVWGSSVTDVFAVGEEGTILHYNGTEWSSMDTGEIDDNFNSVTGSSPDNVYAAGTSGFMLHYDGSSWESVPSPMGAANAKIWMSGPKDIHCTAGSMIYHFDGSSWVSFPYVSYQGLFGLAGSGASNVFAVGNSNTILRYGP
jgi:hypothetical protein